MLVDAMIVGQGISGTCLSYFLEKSGLTYLVIDDPSNNSASKTAAGIINPITGRRLVKTWMIETLMASAKKFYCQFEREFGIECLMDTKMIEFFSTPQIKAAFFQRLNQDDQYLKLPQDQTIFSTLFHYDFGFGVIEPVYLIKIRLVLSTFREHLKNKNLLIEEHFEPSALQVFGDHIRYKHYDAGRIIFCDGIESQDNQYFKKLPFALNKGEALIVAIDDIDSSFLYKRGLHLVPWGEGHFWVGSSYQWEFRDSEPSTQFHHQVVSLLKNWVKRKFKVVDHFASLRPATLERRPFVGFHPLYRTVGIFNGMGTKGCSLAPYFALQLTEHIASGKQVQPDADVQRFARVLGSN